MPDAKERNCYICGADTNRICWCHDGPIWVSDGLPCLCDRGREKVEPLMMFGTLVFVAAEIRERLRERLAEMEPGQDGHA